MEKKIIIVGFLIVAVLGLAWLGVFYWSDGDADKVISSFEECAEEYPVMESYPRQCRTPDGKTFVEDIGNEMEKSDLIRVETPRPNMEVSSPLEINGQARGTWFFEATFTVKLMDDAGNVLAEHYAEAEGEWMTEDFVPFSATLEFDRPETDSGKLILEKANPSGLPENADELEIPVSFASESSAVKDDEECVPAGCSGEVCVEASQADDVVTTCEYKPEYECLRHSTCERQNDGECGWTETREFKECLHNTQQ